MRKLNTSDVFNGLRLIKSSGLKEQLAPVVKKLAAEGADLADSGIIGFLTVLEVFAEHKCESMIYEFLSGPFEITPEEIKEMELDKLGDMLTEMAEGNDLRHFFYCLSGLISKKR